MDLAPSARPKMLTDTPPVIPVTRRIGGGEAVVLQTQIMSGVFGLHGEYINYGSDNGDWRTYTGQKLPKGVCPRRSLRVAAKLAVEGR